MARTSPKSIRLEEEVDRVVSQWLATNGKTSGMDFTALTNLALREFVTREHKIVLKAVTFEEGVKIGAEVMKEYKKVIDELK